MLVDHPRLHGHSPAPDGRRIAYAIDDQDGAAAILNPIDLATGATTEILRIAPDEGIARPRGDQFHRRRRRPLV